MVQTGMLKFRHIVVHPTQDLPVVLVCDLGIVHIPAGELLSQDLVEDIVLVVGDGFVDASLGISLGGNHSPFPVLGENVHSPAPAQGK